MTIENLFPEEQKPKKMRLQEKLLDYIRAGNEVTEEVYQQEIGGKSVSAALHNLESRGHLEPGEHILRGKTLDENGFTVPSYRLIREAPLDVPQKESELNAKSFEPEETKELEIGASDFAEYIGDSDEEPPELLPSMPEVETILVGVRGSQPELIIMFEGDEFKPLRHVMTEMEVRYLITNLMAFMTKGQEE
jgi:hypothetical protein